MYGNSGGIDHSALKKLTYISAGVICVPSGGNLVALELFEDQTHR